MVATRQHRKYTKATKAALVLLADQTSVNAAAEASGVPRTTLEYWLDRPEFVDLRQRAREKWGQDVTVTALLGWGLLAERMPQMSDGDLIDATELATSKALLLTGEATSRSESRELVADFNDGEREAVAAWLREMTREKLHADD